MIIHKQRWYLLFLLLLLSLSGLWGWLSLLAQDTATVSGMVVDANGPVADARVRVRATDHLTFTNAVGHFTLSGLTPGEEVEIAAWADGYYIASVQITPTSSVNRPQYAVFSHRLPGADDRLLATDSLTLTLRPYHTTDHPDYAWASPISGDGACAECHPMIISQWQNNAHGRAIDNARFFSLYQGTNVSGTAVIEPGYVFDFPGTDGNCANCHAPGAGVDGYLTTNMADVRGVMTAGIHCDFCHKVGCVYLNPATGTVYPNAPGVQSQRVLRPPAGDNIFFGPYDDIHDPDTYLPLISESQYCAPCHQFSYWGTPIYESYNEWLSSPYVAAGVTCQDCHMPPNGDSYFALPEKGGLLHPPETIPAHLQLGAASQELLQETVTMTVAVQQVGDQIQVTVVITNTAAGHHVPTDHPGRHLILSVQAQDDQGQALPQLNGPSVPDWGGDLAGLPGQAFAKVLQDVQTGAFPVVSYWKQTLILSDNRLPAGDNNTSVYTFTAPEVGGTVTVTAVLRFRRLFQAEMAARGWQTPDVVMEQVEATAVVHSWWTLYLPLLRG